MAPLAELDAVALAVSGGSDSMALMVLTARWRDRFARDSCPHIVVLSLDHGLRQESSEDCERVKFWAGLRGFAHTTLRWEEPKPESGIQNAARNARYHLMATWCKKHGVDHLVTAHTHDDQAETVLMRLARGTGIDGLAGMAPVSRLNGLTILRPLLKVSRDWLRDVLVAVGQPWIEDPSNADSRFERVRLRNIWPQLEALGMTRKALLRTAMRARAASTALETIAVKFLVENVRLWDGGFCTVEPSCLSDMPEEIVLRMMQIVLAQVSGMTHLPRHEALKRVTDWVIGEHSGALTVFGCLVARRRRWIFVVREIGRMSSLPVMLSPGHDIIWDRRFRVGLAGRDMASGLKIWSIAPLGRDGRAQLKSKETVRRMPAFVAYPLPALWRGKRLIAVPHLGYNASPTVAVNTEFLRTHPMRKMPLWRVVDGHHNGF